MYCLGNDEIKICDYCKLCRYITVFITMLYDKILITNNTDNFKSKIGEHFGVKTNKIFLVPGSDIGIKSVIEAFTDGGRVISSAPSYPMYKVYSELYQCEYFGIPHEKDYTISMEKILSLEIST